MKWHDVFHRANEYTKAAAVAAIDEHADPKIQLNQAIEASQKQYNEFKAAAATVIASYERDLSHRGQIARAIDKLSTSIRAALAKEQSLTASGDTAGATAAHDQAQRFALQLSSYQEQLTHLDEEVLPTEKSAAEAAKTQLDALAASLESEMRKRAELVAAEDRARANDSLNAALSNMSALTVHTGPTLESVTEKIERHEATSRASVALNASDPSLAALEEHARAQNDEADAILAQFQAEALPPGPES